MARKKIAFYQDPAFFRAQTGFLILSGLLAWLSATVFSVLVVSNGGDQFIAVNWFTIYEVVAENSKLLYRLLYMPAVLIVILLPLYLIFVYEQRKILIQYCIGVLIVGCLPVVMLLVQFSQLTDSMTAQHTVQFKSVAAQVNSQLGIGFYVFIVALLLILPAIYYTRQDLKRLKSMDRFWQ
jgi:Na+/H+-translocating membrane pyrophosphatase